jgi:hypothetical protein
MSEPLSPQKCLLILALVLHPRHKFEYFKLMKWLPKWIDNAKGIMRQMYDEVYAHKKDELAQETPATDLGLAVSGLNDVLPVLTVFLAIAEHLR